MLGRERGYLTPDNVIEVLGGVELTPELISAVVGSVTAEGIDGATMMSRFPTRGSTGWLRNS